jgi:hypothetical protein
MRLVCYSALFDSYEERAGIACWFQIRPVHLIGQGITFRGLGIALGVHGGLGEVCIIGFLIYTM